MENTKLEQLIKEAKVGNENAISELYQNGKDGIYYTCLKLLNNSEDALDITQDTFLTVFEKINTLEDYNSYASWQKTIAINKCKNYLIKNKPVLFTDNKMEDLIVSNIEDMDSEFIPHDYIENLEKRNIIMEILDNKLSDVQRISTILFYYEEKSIKDISSILECSEGTVKSRLSSSRRIMKSEIEKIESNGIKLHSITSIPVLSLILQETAKNTIISQEISREIFKAIINNLEVIGGISASLIGGTQPGLIAKVAALIKSSTIAKIATTVVILTTVSTTIALPIVIKSHTNTSDVKDEELVAVDNVEQTKPTEVVKPAEQEVSAEAKEEVKDPVDTPNGATANPEAVKKPTPVPDGGTTVAETPKQPEPQQPVTPSRMSGAEMQAKLKTATYREGQNDSDVTGSYGSCTPTFLSNSMSIINNYLAGSVSGDSAKSQLQGLNNTGDTPAPGYGTAYVFIRSVNVVDVTTQASEGWEKVKVVALPLVGAGVQNLTVTYDSSSDTYHVRGIRVDCGIRFKQ